MLNEENRFFSHCCENPKHQMVSSPYRQIHIDLQSEHQWSADMPQSPLHFSQIEIDRLFFTVVGQVDHRLHLPVFSTVNQTTASEYVPNEEGAGPHVVPGDPAPIGLCREGGRPPPGARQVLNRATRLCRSSESLESCDAATLTSSPARV